MSRVAKTVLQDASDGHGPKLASRRTCGLEVVEQVCMQYGYVLRVKASVLPRTRLDRAVGVKVSRVQGDGRRPPPAGGRCRTHDRTSRERGISILCGPIHGMRMRVEVRGWDAVP